MTIDYTNPESYRRLEPDELDKKSCELEMLTQQYEATGDEALRKLDISLREEMLMRGYHGVVGSDGLCEFITDEEFEAL